MDTLYKGYTRKTSTIIKDRFNMMVQNFIFSQYFSNLQREDNLL